MISNLLKHLVKCAAMITIEIPSVLRRLSENRASVMVPFSAVLNLRGAMQLLVEAFPALKPYLFSSDNQLSSFILFYLNNQDVRYLAGEETPLAAKDTITIILAIAGG